MNPQEETADNGDGTNSEYEMSAPKAMHESLQKLTLKLMECDKNMVLHDIKHLQETITIMLESINKWERGQWHCSG